MGLVAAYGDMLPQLQSEEDLRVLQAHAAASGNMQKSDFRKYLRSLQRAARSNRQTRRKATSADLADLNIIEVREGGQHG